MLPTLLAAAGDPDVNEKLLNGYKVGDKTFKVHIDGFNMLPYLTGAGEGEPEKRPSSTSAMTATSWRCGRATGSSCWRSSAPITMQRLGGAVREASGAAHLQPASRSVRAGRANSNTYWDWMVDHAPQLYLMQGLVAAQIENFVKFPPRQKPASFNLDEVMRQVQSHK